MIVWLVAFHFPTSIVKEKLNPAATLTNPQGSYLSAPCVSIVVASSENNRGDNTDVFKSLPNLDGSKDDIPRPPNCDLLKHLPE
jgi:hypothetical protein